LIEVQGLTKHFDGRPAIVDLTFAVPRGQVLGFLGPDGAGKSTTMRILAGCLGATSGTAAIAGYDVFEHSRELRRRVGYLPEAARLYEEMRVEPYLETMCRLRGVAPPARRARIDHALAACGLTDRRREIISGLPHELQRRVGLAQAVVHDPEVLILDEPAAGLGPAQARETRDLVSELGRRRTVVLSSHVWSEVTAHCDRVLIVRHGRLVADDTPANLARRLTARGGREVLAVVRGDPARLRRHLRRLAGVGEVTTAELGDGDHRVTVTGDGDDLQDAVARVIVQRGFKLKELSSRKPALDDVFSDLAPDEAP
jgi:ABC-2 type transport system ATP-binding protein